MQEIIRNIIEKIQNLGWVFAYYYPDGTEVHKISKKSVPYDEVIDIVKQEAEQCNNGWIPCSERLPSDCAIHEVTAQFSNGKTYTEFAYYDELRDEWWKFDDDGLVNVIAWKEKDEPYQPKGE